MSGNDAGLEGTMSAQRKRHGSPSRTGEVGNKRMRRLEAVNAYLAELNLPPVVCLGDWKEGEMEIVKVMFHVPQGRNMTAVYFQWHLPDDTFDVWPMVYNHDQEQVRFGNESLLISGAISAVVLNNERFVLASQHRPTLDGFDAWPCEFPRGFNPAGMLSLPASTFPFEIPLAKEEHRLDIPSAITRRKLAPFLMDARVRVTRVQFLGPTPENTGSSHNIVAVYRMDVEVDPRDLPALMAERKGTRQIRISYPTFEEAFSAAHRWPDFHQNATAIFMMLRAQRSPRELAAFLRGGS